MTPRKKTTELRDGDEWADVTEDVLPEPASLDGLAPDAAVTALKALRVTGDTAVVEATTGKPLDQVVVGDHAYSGQWADGRWLFDAQSLEMACRVAGWSKVDRDGARWRLS